MFKKGTIVFSELFGFGIVTGVRDDNLISVATSMGTERTFAKEYFKAVDEQLLTYAVNKYPYAAAYITLARAKQYVKEEAVKSISYNDELHTLEGTVQGSNNNEYQVRISAGSATSTQRCSCPVGARCKHCVACLIVFRNKILNLRERAEDLARGLTDEIGNVSLDSELMKLMDTMIYRGAVRIEDAKRCVKLLKENNSTGYIKEFLARLRQEAGVRRDQLQDALLSYIIMNDDVRETLREISSDMSFDFRIRAAINRAYDKAKSMLNALSSIYGYSGNTGKQELYYFFNDRYNQFISTMIGAPEGRINDISGELECIRCMKEDDYVPYGETESRLAECLMNGGTDMRRAQALVSLLEKEKREAVFLSPGYNGKIPASFIRSMTPEAALENIRRMDFSDEEGDAFIECVLDMGRSDSRLAALLFEKAMPLCDFSTAEKMADAAGMLYDSKLLVEYLRWSYKYQISINLSDDHIELSAEPKARKCDPQMRAYFTAESTVGSYEDGRIFVTYVLSSPAGSPAIVLREYDDGTAECLNFLFPAAGFKQYTNNLKYMCVSERGEEIKLALEEERRRYEQKLLAKRYEDLTNEILSLSGSADRSGTRLSEGSRATLEFSFDFETDPVSFSLKVGCERLYVVKDIRHFLDMCRSGSSHKYGTRLELDHTVSNFMPPYDEVLRLLLTAGTDRYFAAKTSPVTEYMLTALLEKLKGEKVYVGDEAFIVSMDEAPLKVSVDNTYRISFRVEDSESCSVYPFDSCILILDRDKGTIRKCTADKTRTELYRFALRNDGMDISPVLDTFKERVYSRMHGAIEVAEDVKDDFKLSDLRIEAYFDFADKKITCATKLYSGERKIDEGELKSEIDKGRYSGYLAYLSNIGFVNGSLENDTDILSFLRMDFSDLRELCDVYLSDSLKNKKLTVFAGATIRVNYDNDLMSAFVEHSEYTEEELEQILSAIRRRRKFVLLRGDRIVALDNEEAGEFNSTVSDLELDSEHLYEAKKLTMVQGLKSLAHERSCKVDDYLSQMVEDIRNYKEADIPVPKVNAVLRPYQVEGFKWLRTISGYGVGGILADDMGLGKTLEIITMIAADDSSKPSLVVCPKSLVFNWKNEFSRFLPGSKVVEVYGTPRKRMDTIASIEPGEKAVYVTAYDSLRNDAELYADISFSNIVLDEAQFIKNVDAQKSRSVKSLMADHRFALTGTPIENNVMDLWSIFDFIMPGYLEEMNLFRNLYGGESDNLERLSKRVGPFILRRTKKDVLQDLPDKYERILTAEMTEEQRKYYDAQVMRARQIMEDGGKVFDLLPYITRLRQVCVDPGTFDEGYEGGSGKLIELGNILDTYLESEEGHKLLIFSSFVKGLNRIEEMLDKKGIAYYMLTGDTPSKRRVEMVDAFNNGDDVRVFLVSLKAGGTGLNLVGADVVIHLDPWWNVAAEDQATDRAHRIGQKRNVEVIKLICEDTIEQKVVDLQNIKKDIIDKVISDDDSSVTGTTLEDLAFVLS